MSDDTIDFPELDRVVHQPSRLQILTVLAAVENADFLYLLRETGLTKGNLSTHLTKLEHAGLVAIEKTYDGKIPVTLCELTAEGRARLADYRRELANIMSRLPE